MGSAQLVPHFTGDQMPDTIVSKKLTVKSKLQKNYQYLIGGFTYLVPYMYITFVTQ